MGIRETRLAQELEKLDRLRQQSTLIDFMAEGNPPDNYLVTYRCVGMLSPDQEGNEHLVRIYLHSDFPREPPKVTFLTQIFHPNIVSAIQVPAVQARIKAMLDAAPDEVTRQRILIDVLSDKDLHEGHVCLDTLDLNWSPAITLDMVCVELGEMIQYKRYNPRDPLNDQAAEWALLNKHLLPVDTRSLRELVDLENIRIISESSLLEDSIHLL